MFKKIWRRLFSAKRPFKLTGPGWVFILYTIGVGAGAINTGNNLLYLVFGIFLGLLLASGFLSDLSLWGVAVDPVFPHAVEAGKPASIFLNVSNTKRWLPSVSVTVTLEGLLDGKPVQLKLHIPFIAAHGSTSTRFEWSPPARGWFQMRMIRLSTRYPFGLLEKWWRLHFDFEGDGAEHIGASDEGLFVTPGVVPLDAKRLANEALGEEAEISALLRGDSAVLFGLRSYAPGDNPRRIHWKASAKRAPVFAGDNAWLMRDMHREEKDDVIFLCPSPERAQHLSQFETEQLVAFLASAVAACRAAGFEPRIMLADRLAADEAALLALWDPRLPASASVQRYLTADAAFGPTRRFIDLLEAFRVRDAG